MNLKLTFLCALLLAFSFITSFGQTGDILLTVVDKNIGEALIGATVQIEGTQKGAITDLDGIASLKKLDPGIYNLKVSYVSYESISINDVEVEPGLVNKLSVQMASSETAINEVVVTAKALKNNENTMLILQQQSPKLFDAISADVFSKAGASDAAGALKRVTGVTVESGKYVFVRGLGDRYSKSNLNGSDVPSLDPNNNSLQLDLFPTNLIDNIIVYKTFTPDLPGDFAGGLVDITTKDFPESFNLQVSGGVEYNENASLNEDFLTAKGSSTDFLGFDNGFRALPDLLKQYTPETFPDPYMDKPGITLASRAFSNRHFEPDREAPFLNHSLSFSVGDQFDIFKRPLGFILGLSYNRGYSNYFNGVQNVYEGISLGQTTLNNDILSAADEQKSTDDVLIGLLFNTSYKITPNNKIGITLLMNQGGTQEVRYQEGYQLDYSPDSAVHLQNRTINYTQRAFRNGQVRGEHVIPALNNLNFRWSNSFTLSTIEQPDFRLIKTLFSFDTYGDTLFTMPNTTRPNRFYRDLEEINNNSKLDFTLPVKLFGGRESKIRFGALYTYKDRTFKESIYQYNIQDKNGYNGDISVIFENDVLGYVNDTLRNFLQVININGNNYNAYQRLLASYLMIESHVFRNFSITTGVRFERTNMYLKALNDSTGKIRTLDFLPSLALTYNLGERSNLRISANRTMARPSFREFAPLATYDFFGGYIQNGNPNLERTLINNYDLRWEMFPSPGEYLAFSLFYKKFLNPIENAQLPRAGGSGSQFQYKNVDESQLYGFEIELRKNLSMFGNAFQHFKVTANFAYVYAFVNVTAPELVAIRTWDPSASTTRPMFNQAPYSFNGSLTYENPDKGWEATLTANVSGHRLIVYQIDLPSIYITPSPDLDFNLSKRITQNISFSIKAKNILNNVDKERILLNDKIYYTTKNQLGRSFSFSLSYKIN